MIEAAKSGRSSCRTCREKIGKGELRFGEVDYTFDPDGSFKWHHLLCAAKKLGPALEDAIADFAGELPDKEQLLQAIEEGRRGTAFPRAELAPSGRSSCLACSEKIPKGELRVVVEREVERIGKRPGYLHPKCAAGHIEDVDDLPATIKANSALEPEQLASLDGLLG